MIDSPSHAITLLGGTKIVAERRSRPLTTVASWVSRESIPVTEWPGLIALAKSGRVDGFTYEALALAHTDRAKPTKRRRAA